ncbi:DeoR/GlpR family DNA-binding transcription regulator [Clostridium sp. DJ247]|uniref:DeoR/GlpR family DNA-binding transcription regulator n=1 Tax=Clostridium sp. DJ247 TaxID=2726188 RepID=UPI0016262A98|nr:DeoR/GlpR family DNA-binding transcription regulator [Clostridium sp. DJ247]MBC2582609.1 DeoR/GlpR transcriptional regulator [Clostridium sp. DJ247]
MYESEYNIPSYEDRLKLHFEEKKNIAQKALLFIHKNKNYFFDVSTNIQLLAKLLNEKVNVFTHSLDNIKILSEKKDVFIYSMGGCFNKKNRFFYKPGCTNYFEELEFDAAFIGAAAIMKDGIYYADEEDAFIKQEAVKKSKKVILLAEHQKYQNSSCYKGLDWNQVDIIILDQISSTSFVDIIKSQNIQIDPNTLLIM